MFLLAFVAESVNSFATATVIEVQLDIAITSIWKRAIVIGCLEIAGKIHLCHIINDIGGKVCFNWSTGRYILEVLIKHNTGLKARC